ncbi:MAG: hypothetical protein JWO83_3441 [Caulobacteraceae bacterium]|jgi:hypothetical protein|nr:hypothetical protein [Caulobacteraceae bacterium]
MIRKILLAGASAMAFSALVSATVADATTVDFTTLPYGTPVTNQFPGLTFTLKGAGSQYGTTPTIGTFGSSYLGNSAQSAYPTAQILDIGFSSPVKNVSFGFSNFGYSKYGSGDSFATTLDKLGNVEASVSVNNVEGGIVSIGGNSVSDLQINNNGNNWLFGVSELTYSASVPEPSTWAMLLGGFGFIGYVLRRRVLRTA